MKRSFLIRIFPIVFVMLFSAAGCNNGVEEEPDPRPPVAVDKVISEDIIYKLQRVGSLEAKETVMIKCEAEGRIQDILFEEGGWVEKDSILIKIDDAKIKTTMDQLKARLRQTETQLANSLKTLKRKEPLVNEGLVSQQDYDDLIARIDIEKATLVEIKAQLAHNRELLEDTEVRAPFSGATSERQVSPGDFMRMGDPIVRLVQLNPLEISFRVDEKYKEYLTPRLPVTVTVAAYPDQTFKGEVFFISPDIDITTRTFLVKGRIDNKMLLLNPGMFAEVTIETKTHKDALIVPWKSVIQLEDETYVYVVTDGTAHKVPITLGQLSEESAEVFGDLEPGQAVVTDGKYTVKDGTAVKIIRGQESEVRSR